MQLFSRNALASTAGNQRLVATPINPIIAAPIPAPVAGGFQAVATGPGFTAVSNTTAVATVASPSAPILTPTVENAIFTPTAAQVLPAGTPQTPGALVPTFWDEYKMYILVGGGLLVLGLVLFFMLKK